MHWFDTDLYARVAPQSIWRAALTPVVIGSTPSTNDVARELMAEGAAAGTVVVAREQVAGRGRLERGWSSPPGGLWFSLVLRPQTKGEELGVLPLTVAVAMAQALTTAGVTPGLKWPNDLLVGREKLGGILMERDAQGVVAGIGINVNQDIFLPPLAGRATSLYVLTGRRTALERILAAALHHIHQRYREWEKDGGVRTLQTWRRYSITLGRTVKVTLVDGQVEGEAVDIDKTGSLLVQTADGVRTITAGDVALLRPV